MAVLTGDGERAVSEVTQAQLEVASTEAKGVALLECAEVKRVLAAQKLTAAGLAEPATAAGSAQARV